MARPEIIAGDWKFKKIDSLSWQVFERREIRKCNNPNTKSREGEVDWVGMPAYFGTLKPALMKARELNRERKLGTSDLDAAIARIEASDRAFEKAVAKALAEAGLK